MWQFNPKNPNLFKQLQSAVKQGEPYGTSFNSRLHRGLPGGEVKVANQGQDMAVSYVPGPDRIKMNIQQWGESYRVCCPYCGDTRHRLYVSHKYGQYDPKTNSRNTTLLCCYNENCHADPDNREDFKNRLEVQIIGSPTNVVLPQTTIVKPSDLIEEPTVVPFAGDRQLLTSLPETHRAIQWCKSRGFLPRHIEKYFRAYWCENSKYPQVRGRIVFPVYFNEKHVGYQARFIGNGDGNAKNAYQCNKKSCQHLWYSDTKPTACPSCGTTKFHKVVKFWTGPGTKKSTFLYNYDVAKTYDYVVVMEGPLDVINAGSPKRSQVTGPCVAAFGKTLSTTQINLLRKYWGDKTVYICFDPEEIEKTLKILKPLYPLFPNGIVPVLLDDGHDPGDTPHNRLWKIIRRCGQDVGAKFIPCLT